MSRSYIARIEDVRGGDFPEATARCLLAGCNWCQVYNSATVRKVKLAAQLGALAHLRGAHGKRVRTDRIWTDK